MRTLALLLALAMLAACQASSAAPTPGSSPPREAGIAADDAVVAAFADHRVVAIGEIHGSSAEHEFLRSLVADPRLLGIVTTVAVEFGSARHQRTIDRFVRGGPVDPDRLALVWTDTTQRSGVWDDPIYREFFDAVRDLNRARPPDQQVRVLLGDPPIDWDRITDCIDCDAEYPTCLDYWIFRRDQHFAAVVQAAVDEGSDVLVIAGSGHVLRNPDQPEVHALVDRLDAANRGQVWTLVPVDPAGAAALAPLVDARSGQGPRAFPTTGSPVGALDAVRLFGGGTVTCDPGPCPSDSQAPVVHVDAVADSLLVI